MSNENRINAVNIHAGIGGQVLAASLVLLGIILGYFDIRNIGVISLKGVLLLLAIIFLFASIITGALGLKRLRDLGNRGIWRYSYTHQYFRWQTLMTFAALLLFSIVFFLKSEPSNLELESIKMNHNLEQMITINSAQRIEISKAKLELDSIKNLLKPKSVTVRKSKKRKKNTCYCLHKLKKHIR